MNPLDYAAIAAVLAAAWAVMAAAMAIRDRRRR